MACLEPTGLKNNRWSFEEIRHRRWCLTHTSEEVANERNERASLLDHCGECRTYAHQAYLAAKFNVEHKCGFTGPRCQTDEQAHFDWCMGLAPDTAYMLFLFVPVNTLQDNNGESKLYDEEKARDEGVGECIATKNIDQPLTALPSVNRARYSVNPRVFTPVPKERGIANDPCPPGAARTANGACGRVSPSKVNGSGLLENDQESPPQGPAATGAPGAATGAAGGGSPTFSRAVR